MSTVIAPHLTGLAADVSRGLTRPHQKQLSPALLYDHLGSALFEAITLLSEYGLTRADERLMRRIAGEAIEPLRFVSAVAELGSGSGKKTKHILELLLEARGAVPYFPIDVSQGALDACERELSAVADVRPVCASWIDGLEQVVAMRGEGPMLTLFLGSTVGNLQRAEVTPFLRELRAYLRQGDLFLLGADLLKPLGTMLTAYDDPAGVTAAFNRNVLGRINRDLGGHFDLTTFRHEARWNEHEHRIEMHLVSACEQTVAIDALPLRVHFREGESIWTEASHKFSEHELNVFAAESGFAVVTTWIDNEWPFAETLWRTV